MILRGRSLSDFSFQICNRNMMKDMPIRLGRRAWLALFVLAALAGTVVAADQPVEARKPPVAPKVGMKLAIPAAFSKKTPATVDDLQAMQAHVAKLVKKIQAATVGVRAGGAQGSGVIVSKDGYVLTAGHVSGAAGRRITIIMPNGKTYRATSLGANQGVDSGMIKITDKGTWPFLPIGDMKDVKNGSWCIATGHPGGYRTGRPPVVRLGRVIFAGSTVIQTDAVLVGGDSGGPLFDMHGRVIGINSRIGRSVAQNIHVPISTFSNDWERLARSEVWGSRGRGNRAILGITGVDHPKGCRVDDVPQGYPAAKGGLKVGDIITRFDGKPVKTFKNLVDLVAKKKPGDKIVVEYLRDDKTMKATLTLARR